MTKKAIKRLIKKKVVKRNLRHILTNKSKQSNEPNQKTNVINSSSLPIINSSSNLRNQLLQRANMIPSFGYMSQQYGNINNERRIDQLKNDNQTMTNMINSDKATLDAMNQEKARLDAQINDLKKKRKEAKQNLKKATIERKAAEDDANEAELDEQRTRRELKRKRSAQKRYEEVSMENNVIRYKLDADSLDALVHQKELENQALKDQQKQNKEYQEYKKRSDTLKTLIAENKGLEGSLNSTEFTESNKYLIQMVKKQEEEKLKNQLLLMKREQEKELFKLKIALESAPDEKTLKAITDQYTKDIGEINKQILETKDKIAKLKEPIEERKDI